MVSRASLDNVAMLYSLLFICQYNVACVLLPAEVPSMLTGAKESG